MDAFGYQSEYMKIDILPNKTVMGIVVSAWRGPKNEQYIHAVVASRCGKERKVKDNFHLFSNLPPEGIAEEIQEITGLLMLFVICRDKVPNLVQGDFVCIEIMEVLPGDNVFCVMGIVLHKAASPPELHIEYGWKTTTS